MKLALFLSLAACGLCIADAAAAAGKATTPTSGKAFVDETFLTIQVGDYKAKFLQKWAWTLRACDFQGKKLLIPGGVFQTVVNEQVPKGTDSFIGGGHRPESLQSIELLVDGKPYEPKPGLTVEGSSFTVHKTTRISAFWQDARVTVDADGIAEDFRYEVKGDTSKVNFMYPFMHCFTNDTRRWIAALADGSEMRGTFTDDMAFTLKKDILWAMVYAPKTAIGAVYAYPEAYKTIRIRNAFWNRKHDNKLYLTVNPKRQVGDTFHYAVRLKGFAAGNDDWERVGRETLKHVQQALAVTKEQ